MPLSSLKNQCACELFKIGAVKFGSFTLKSGILSPIYIDLRLIISYPRLLKEITTLLWNRVHSLSFDLVCGVPYTALPLATALSLEHEIPMVMRRKEAKDYGTKKMIEGAFQTGQTCLVIEDLITSGMSIFETTTLLEKEGIKVHDIAVLLDRQQGGKQLVLEKGYHLHSLWTLEEFLGHLAHTGYITPATVADVQSFIQANQVGVC